MIVPHEHLAFETLRVLVTDCVCRKIGMVEELDEQIAAACRRLECGEARLVFDQDSGALEIVSKLDCIP